MKKLFQESREDFRSFDKSILQRFILRFRLLILRLLHTLFFVLLAFQCLMTRCLLLRRKLFLSLLVSATYDHPFPLFDIIFWFFDLDFSFRSLTLRCVLDRARCFFNFLLKKKELNEAFGCFLENRQLRWVFSD